MSFKSHIFNLLFPQEAQTLDRYRLHIGEVERWFSSCDPELAQAATWIRQYSEPKLPQGEEPSGLSISGLRTKLFGHTQFKKVKKPPELTTSVRYIVETMSDKLDLIQAFHHIHDSRDIDTNIPMVNTLCHSYLKPSNIFVRQTYIQPDKLFSKEKTQ